MVLDSINCLENCSVRYTVMEGFSAFNLADGHIRTGKTNGVGFSSLI